MPHLKKAQTRSSTHPSHGMREGVPRVPAAVHGQEGLRAGICNTQTAEAS
jgi:hypothetical protein